MKEYSVEIEKESLKLRGFEVFLQEIKMERAVSAHIHSAIEIIYIISGEYRVFADEEEFLLGKGDLILFRSNTIHRIFKLTPENGFYYVFKISPELVSELSYQENTVAYLLSLSVNNRNAKKVWSRNECEANGLANEIKKFINPLEGYCMDIERKLSVGRIIHTILKDTQDFSQFEGDSENLTRSIYDVLIYINKHFSEELTAKECSDMVYMSYSYFSRNFKNIVNMSFKDYLNLTRINHAEKRLFSTNKTITQISAECGFNSVSYFIAVYKRLKGKTPQMARGENGKGDYHEIGYQG